MQSRQRGLRGQRCEEIFPTVNVKVETFGSTQAATAFLEGLAAEETCCEELNHRDRNNELLITLRTIKSEVTP